MFIYYLYDLFIRSWSAFYAIFLINYMAVDYFAVKRQWLYFAV